MAIPPDKLRIGRALLAGGPITQQQLQAELERSGKSGSVLGKALLQSGFPSEEELVIPLLSRLRIPKINARNTKIPLETIRLVPRDVATRCKVLAIDELGGILVVVTPDIGNIEALAEVRQATQHLVTPIQCAPDGFDEIVADYYQRLAEAGLEPVATAQPVGSAAPLSQNPPAGVNGANGAVRAVPADDQDFFWKRFMSAGPVPAEEVQM